jgi:hypothetical protein
MRAFEVGEQSSTSGARTPEPAGLQQALIRSQISSRSNGLSADVDAGDLLEVRRPLL